MVNSLISLGLKLPIGPEQLADIMTGMSILGYLHQAWRLSGSEPQDMTVETHCVRQQNTILIQTVVFSLICQ